jgi:hypothetical protein
MNKHNATAALPMGLFPFTSFDTTGRSTMNVSRPAIAPFSRPEVFASAA